jgi:hypothetical protein
MNSTGGAIISQLKTVPRSAQLLSENGRRGRVATRGSASERITMSGGL